MKRVILMVALVMLAACAPAPNPAEDVASLVNHEVAGFWLGLWHGLISSITFWVSLFTDVSVYEVHNNGGWYNLGFLMGAGSTYKAVEKRGKK